MSLHHAYLIKGWLLAMDPPAAVTEALEAIIAHFDRPITSMDGRTGDQLRWTELPQADRQAEMAAADHAADSIEAPVAHGDAAPAPSDVPAQASEQPNPRQKRNFSPEARAAAAERMRQMQARKKAERAARESGQEAEPEPPRFTAEDLRITVPVPRRKCRLTDADWPEIQEMLAAGRDRKLIASDFDESPDDLDAFIAAQLRRTGKPPGEAQASPPGGACDATRQTW